MTDFGATTALIPCCICGVPIEPNPSSMCLDCLRQQADFTQEIPNTSSIIYCKSCGRYQTNPTTWTFAELESPELLKICMKRVTGLKEMKIIDAHFLYTEPHSRRIRVSLTVQKPYNSTILRQTLIITFVVQLQQCPQCCEAATPREHWIANVQVREAGKHKRTLFWLEQQILANRAHGACTSIERKHDGVDFHFATKAAANNFVNFVKSKLPIKYEESNKLMGEDIQSAIQDRRFSLSVRVPPINRQELVLLPPHLVQKSGNQCFIGVCFKVNRNIKLIDPVTAKIISVDGPKYWNFPFETLLTLSSLKKFVVLSIETTGPRIGRFQTADVELTDEETYQDRIIVKTHLGNELKEGEGCLAYDIRTTMISDDAMDVFKKHDLPEVIIVGRTHQTSQKKNRQRPWHVKQVAPTFSDDQQDFEEFLDDLEDNPDLRKGIEIYKNPETKEDDPAIQESMIALSEMKIE
ncbi:NMD3 family protein [Tritrichomonas foetus]|uniref:60S ribosomal export protein NMD3 n=1 Tax=Tritrichomonas foetus TaxID=1144522 RepID=A0A1J4KZR1_9EUKA|nr:NMD3 family protein [Tritrichomonas foetus]|eukprot:OHT16745.1 NMD3 family protein [Tritrichomonas foetus]